LLTWLGWLIGNALQFKRVIIIIIIACLQWPNVKEKEITMGQWATAQGRNKRWPCTVSDPQQLPQCHTWATQLLLTVYSSIILLFPNSICTDFFY